MALVVRLSSSQKPDMTQLVRGERWSVCNVITHFVKRTPEAAN